jgi:hypothetical protein
MVVGLGDSMSGGADVGEHFEQSKLGQGGPINMRKSLFGRVDIRRLNGQNGVDARRGKIVSHGISMQSILGTFVANFWHDTTTEVWSDIVQELGRESL